MYQKVWQRVHHSRSSLTISIFATILLFIGFGVAMVYNVSVVESFVLTSDPYHFVRSQAQWAILGILTLLVTAKIPTRFWLAIGPIVFGIALVLMVAVLIPGIGSRIAGASRWIQVGGFTMQPSELLKFSLVLYLASWLQKPRRFLSFALLVVGIFGLVMAQPDLGTGLIILSIATGMYVLAGKPFKHLVWLAIGGGVGISLLILLSPYRMQRLTTFLNPESDPLGTSYHIRQITIALGNGGLFGQGLGMSKQKYRYIPEATTDSIFAIIAEELGFFMCGMIIIGYIALLRQMSKKVQGHEAYQAVYLVGCGVICWIGSQVLVNLSSIVALIPLTGVPLPFISYGGSALVTLCAAVGILLGLSTTQQQRRSRRV